MKLTLSTYKAIKYACEHFHYAHVTPVNPLGYNVYNDAGEWCGVVLFGHGATVNIGKPYGLKQGEILELTRVALNGKQECTSQAVAMALKQLHKDCPLCRLVVSYADADQKHLGTIYQATNWIYEGLLNVGDKSAFIIHGRKVHRRSVGAKIINGRPCVQSLEAVRKYFDPNATEFVTEGKHKYCMPMDKAMRRQLAHLAKPYPKNDGEWTKIDRNIFKNRNNSTTDIQKRMETHLRGV